MSNCIHDPASQATYWYLSGPSTVAEQNHENLSQACLWPEIELGTP
jgi:hypothetical protein